MFNQDALFKGYKKRLEKLPKSKAGSEATRMVSGSRPSSICCLSDLRTKVIFTTPNGVPNYEIARCVVADYLQQLFIFPPYTRGILQRSEIESNPKLAMRTYLEVLPA